MSTLTEQTRLEQKRDDIDKQLAFLQKRKQLPNVPKRSLDSIRKEANALSVGVARQVKIKGLDLSISIRWTGSEYNHDIYDDISMDVNITYRKNDNGFNLLTTLLYEHASVVTCDELDDIVRDSIYYKRFYKKLHKFLVRYKNLKEKYNFSFEDLWPC